MSSSSVLQHNGDFFVTLLAASPSVPLAIDHPIDSLSRTAKSLYATLCDVAEIVKVKRGYHPNASQVTFFCPLEVICAAIGVKSRQTIYNHLPELATSGLVAQRGHYCTHNGATRSDGSLWAVKLDLEVAGKAHIDFDWLKASHRNLGADIERGNTAFAVFKNFGQSNQRDKKQVDTDLILSYALNTYQPSFAIDCPKNNGAQLESLLDVPYAPLEGRGDAVDMAASAACAALGAGSTNIMFFRWLVWALLRLEKQNKDYFYQVYLMIQRVGIDKREGAANNPAGLLVHRLKSSGIWDDLRSVQRTRVGLPPS